MYTKQPTHVTVISEVDFGPRIEFIGVLPKIAKKISELLGTPHWATNAQFSLLRNADKSTSIIITHRKVQMQTIGLSPWVDDLESHVKCFETALDEFECEIAPQARIEYWGFFTIQLKHSEIVDLMFGSFFQPFDAFSGMLDSCYDGKLQLIGEHKGKKLRTDIIPMTSSDVTTTASNLPNIETFIDDPKIFDRRLASWHDEISHDCLYIAVEVKQEKIAVTELGTFFQDAMEIADEVSDNVVSKLKSLPPKDS